jgi:aspartate/methionine/tyrosine aminotransferase
MASGIPVFVSIDYNSNNGNWIFDIDALEKAITQKTKVILINSPMNPTGRMLTLDELQSIAIMLQRYPNIIVISDEVYDYLYFNPDKKHISLASLAGMFDRTITISSAAKTFSITGWKVGWAVSSKNLIDQMMASQQWIVYSICTPAQKALSKIIANANNQYKDDENGLLYETYYDYLRQSYHKKIIKLVEYCREVDLKPIIPDGAFYVLCDISNIHIPDKYLNETDDEGNRLSNDWAFCMFLTREIKVSAIPASAFYLRKEMKYKAQNLIRLCACKLDSTLEEAGNRLKRLKEFHI